jgi:hypothetical protein
MKGERFFEVTARKLKGGRKHPALGAKMENGFGRANPNSVCAWRRRESFV